MAKKPILVVGSTGLLGSEICRKLVASGYRVRALVRTTSAKEKLEMLEAAGVETITGDLKDESSLLAALNGCSAVISTASSTLSRAEGDSIQTVDREGQLNLIAAAEKSGVSQFIYTSFFESTYASPLQDAKRIVENRLKSGRMTYTILRANFFREIWLSPHLGFDPPNAKATIYGHGVNKISFISFTDVAAFAVAALINPHAFNTTIEIGGMQSLSPLEIVKIFERKLKTSFTIQYVPEEALKQQYEMAVDDIQKSFAALMLTYAGGVVTDMERNAKNFNIHLSTIEDYADQLVSSKKNAGVMQ